MHVCLMVCQQGVFAKALWAPPSGITDITWWSDIIGPACHCWLLRQETETLIGPLWDKHIYFCARACVRVHVCLCASTHAESNNRQKSVRARNKSCSENPSAAEINRQRLWVRRVGGEREGGGVGEGGRDGWQRRGAEALWRRLATRLRRRSKSLSGQSHRQSHPSNEGIQLLNKAKSMFSQVLNGSDGRFIGRQPRVLCELHRHRAVKRPHNRSKKKKKRVRVSEILQTGS